MFRRFRSASGRWTRFTTSPLLALVAAALILPVPVSARGWLGVSVQDVTEELQEAMDLSARSGALVSDVVDNGPAEKADIRARDVILRVDDRPVEDSEDLIGYLATKDEGDEIRIHALRGDREVELEVVLGDRPSRGDLGPLAPRAIIPPMPPSFDIEEEPLPKVLSLRQGSALGVSVHSLDRNLAPYFRTKEGQGLLVLDVEEGSPAEKAGIQTGDVILSFNGVNVDSTTDLRDGVRSLAAGDDWKSIVIREGREKEIRGRMERGWQNPSDMGDIKIRRQFRENQDAHSPRAGSTPDQSRALRRLERRLEELQQKLERMEERLERRLRDN